jgi:hypothetical protein
MSKMSRMTKVTKRPTGMLHQIDEDDFAGHSESGKKTKGFKPLKFPMQDNSGSKDKFKDFFKDK